jgi:hypothetical protein
MSDLETLFLERDKFFEEKTQEIFKEIYEALEAVTIFLTDIDDLIAQGNINWEDANMMDDLVILIGMVTYEPGDTIKISDDLDVIINEENIDNFQRIVHMSVPLDLVKQKDKDTILSFLYDMNVERTPEEFSSVLDETTKIPIKKEEEFDLSDLDEHQIQSLKYFSDNKGKN